MKLKILMKSKNHPRVWSHQIMNRLYKVKFCYSACVTIQVIVAYVKRLFIILLRFLRVNKENKW